MTTMKSGPSSTEIFAYFRIGLVTGVIDKPEVIEWADDAILQGVEPVFEIIELSFSGRQPYSQIIRLLNLLQHGASLNLPLKMLFARAGMRLEKEPERASELIAGLRLLLAEEYLPKEIKSQLIDLENCLELQRQNMITLLELEQHLTGFLAGYEVDRCLLPFPVDSSQ